VHRRLHYKPAVPTCHATFPFHPPASKGPFVVVHLSSVYPHIQLSYSRTVDRTINGCHTYLTATGSSIGHCILDMISKNIWGIIGNALRVKVNIEFWAKAVWAVMPAQGTDVRLRACLLFIVGIQQAHNLSASTCNIYLRTALLLRARPTHRPTPRHAHGPAPHACIVHRAVRAPSHWTIN
jgi:hypothetical protein